MYTTNAKPAPERQLERAACWTLVGSAIAFGVCRFWDIQIPAAPLLTPALGALSVLLATAALRLEEAARKRAWATLGLGIVLTLVCLLFEATMTHMGLEWLNEREQLAPDWALWPASIGLSLFNAAAGFVFLREIPDAQPARKVLPAPRLVQPPVRDPELADIVAKIDQAVSRRKAG